MASVEDLLKRQRDKLEKQKEREAQRSKKRIKRSGPTRPWQEFLPADGRIPVPHSDTNIAFVGSSSINNTTTNKQGDGVPESDMTLAQHFRDYPAPAGFKSQEERQEEARLADARKRQEALHKARRERFETEFEVWLAELTEQKKKELLSGTQARPESQMAKALFREAFVKETGFTPPPAG